MVISKKTFNKMAIKMVKQHYIGMKINSEAMRYLRREIVDQVHDHADVEEVLLLVFSVLDERGVRKVRREHLAEWLGVGATVTELPPAVAEATAASDGETEWEPTASLAAQPLWDVRRILDTFKRDGKRYYLVDWQPTEEPAANIPYAVIASFNRQRRALVRRTYIETQAHKGI